MDDDLFLLTVRSCSKLSWTSDSNRRDSGQATREGSNSCVVRRCPVPTYNNNDDIYWFLPVRKGNWRNGASNVGYLLFTILESGLAWDFMMSSIMLQTCNGSSASSSSGSRARFIPNVSYQFWQELNECTIS